jgi:hypothetical protein
MDCKVRGQVFDYEGQHPNIIRKGGKKQFENAANYLKKDGYWGGNLADEEVEGYQAEDIWAMAVDEKEETEFERILRCGDPKSYIKSYINIREYKRDNFKKDHRKFESRYTQEDFENVPQVMQDYARYILGEEEIERPRGLVIISESRFGKTQWARSITKNHGYLCTEWNPKKIDQDCDLLIFDDIPMSELLPRNRWKPFFGMQEEFEITGKYTSSISVLRSWKGFIFLCNEDPREEEGVSAAVRNYININCDVITLETPLF